MFEAFLRQVAAGLATGGIYASVALALVMIYKSTRTINFAQGEMAMFSTYLAWAMIQAGIPYWVAFAATVVLSFVLGLLIERLILRQVPRDNALAEVVVCIGLMVIFNSIAGWIFSTSVRVFPSPFDGVIPGNHYFSAHDLGSVGVTLCVLVLLFAFFRFTPLGLAMRAAAQNPVSSRLVGIRVGWMLALGWGLAGGIGAIAGMMVAPKVLLDPTMMSSVLLYAFAAALLGGIENPLGAVVGGFLMGIIENLLGVYVIGNDLKLTAALVLIVAVLIVRPAGLLGKTLVTRV
ncbi:MAG: branched-chain amino acid ABC transporter permease [Janthinobacterium lividum]